MRPQGRLRRWLRLLLRPGACESSLEEQFRANSIFFSRAVAETGDYACGQRKVLLAQRWWHEAHQG